MFRSWYYIIKVTILHTIQAYFFDDLKLQVVYKRKIQISNYFSGSNNLRWCYSRSYPCTTSNCICFTCGFPFSTLLKPSRTTCYHSITTSLHFITSFSKRMFGIQYFTYLFTFKLTKLTNIGIGD